MQVADIGHCMLSLDQHKFWSGKLETEFFNQGDLEKEAKLAISPLMDRTKPGPSAASNQVHSKSVYAFKVAYFLHWTAFIHYSSFWLRQKGRGYLSTISFNHSQSSTLIGMHVSSLCVPWFEDMHAWRSRSYAKSRANSTWGCNSSKRTLEFFAHFHTMSMKVATRSIL